MTREEQMITLRRKPDGEPSVWCDPEIADIVDALNTDKLATVASCSGHGYRPGIIALSDGRCLMVFDDMAHMEPAELAYPLDVNGSTEWREASLEEEVERLREALWKIERNEDAAYSRDLARAALNPQPTGKEGSDVG